MMIRIDFVAGSGTGRDGTSAMRIPDREESTYRYPVDISTCWRLRDNCQISRTTQASQTVE